MSLSSSSAERTFRLPGGKARVADKSPVGSVRIFPNSDDRPSSLGVDPAKTVLRQYLTALVAPFVNSTNEIRGDLLNAVPLVVSSALTFNNVHVSGIDFYATTLPLPEPLWFRYDDEDNRFIIFVDKDALMLYIESQDMYDVPLNWVDGCSSRCIETLDPLEPSPVPISSVPWLKAPLRQRPESYTNDDENDRFTVQCDAQTILSCIPGIGKWIAAIDHLVTHALKNYHIISNPITTGNREDPEDDIHARWTEFPGVTLHKAVRMTIYTKTKRYESSFTSSFDDNFCDDHRGSLYTSIFDGL